MKSYRISRKDITSFLYGIVDDLDLFREWFLYDERPGDLLANYPASVVEKWKTPLDFLDRIKRELLFFAHDVDEKERNDA